MERTDRAVVHRMDARPQHQCRGRQRSAEANQLARQYLWVMGRAGLTEVESVFRARTSERGLRPIFHHKERRADGHRLISVLATPAVPVLRTQMTDAGAHDSGSTRREICGDLRRTPTAFRRKDGQIAPVRKTATPDVRCRPRSPQPDTHCPTTAQHPNHCGLATRHPPPNAPRRPRRQTHASGHDENWARHGLTQIHTTLKMG